MTIDSREDVLPPRPVVRSGARGRHRDSASPVADTRMRGLVIIVSSSVLGITALAAAQAATGITIASTDAVAAPVIRAAAPILGLAPDPDEVEAQRRREAAERAAREKQARDAAAAKAAAEKAAAEKAAAEKAAAAKAAQERAAADRAAAVRAAADKAAREAAARAAAQEKAAAEQAARDAAAQAAQQRAAAEAAKQQAAAAQAAAQAQAAAAAAEAARKAQEQAAAQQAAAARAQAAAEAAAAAARAPKAPTISSFSCTRGGSRIDARVTFSTGNTPSTITFDLGGAPIVRTVAANANTANGYMSGLPSTAGAPCRVTISNPKGSVTRTG